ncbi:hypothetical protein Hanom_Chr02g00105481 [Helianthus anomalus]
MVRKMVETILDNEGCSSESKRKKYIVRNRITAHHLLVRDYFSPNPTYDATTFRHRFRMNHDLFLRISNDVLSKYEYFQQKTDACGSLGFSTLQKVTTAIRHLAYGTSSDIMDEYIKMFE